MTLNGAIMQLVEMRENSMMPVIFKPYFDKVIETISECEEPSAQPDTRKATWAIHTYMPHNYYCTNCKQDSPYNKIWDFCPLCGFKMEDYV